MCHGVSLSKSLCSKTDAEIDVMTRIPYASAIGSIMYGMLCTRSDVAHALSVTSIYQSNPGQSYWKAVKDIIKYLRRTKDCSWYMGMKNLKLKALQIQVFNLMWMSHNQCLGLYLS